MAKLTTAEFIDAIKELSVLELNDLVKACEEEFGVSAAAGVVVAAAGADGASILFIRFSLLYLAARRPPLPPVFLAWPVPVWVRVDLGAVFLGSGFGISFCSSLSGTGWMLHSWFSPNTSCQIWAWVPFSTRIPTRSMTLSARTLRSLTLPPPASTICQR